MSPCLAPNFHKEVTVFPRVRDFAQLTDRVDKLYKVTDETANPCYLPRLITLNSLFLSRRLKNMQSVYSFTYSKIFTRLSPINKLQNRITSYWFLVKFVFSGWALTISHQHILRNNMKKNPVKFSTIFALRMMWNKYIISYTTTHNLFKRTHRINFS